MNFTTLAQLFQQLETTASRNEVTEVLARFIPSLAQEEVAPAMYLLQGRLVPTFVDLEFNMSTKLAIRALQTIAGESVDAEKIYKELGDVGLAAEQVLESKPIVTSDLSINHVYDSLVKLATLSGAGSQEEKINQLAQLLRSLDPIGAKYVSRVVIGSLRLGVSDKTVLDSLSWMVSGDKALREEIERAFGAKSDIGKLTSLILESIRSKQDQESSEVIQHLNIKLAQIKLEPGVPVASKLVEREKSPQAAFSRMGKSIVQPKLDGMRAQVHYNRNYQLSIGNDQLGGHGAIFSRNMESLTAMFPDVLAAVAELNVDSIIFDSEVIGYDFENDIFLPFQETMQRRRKHDVDETAANIPVKAMAFDLLYLNGEDLSRHPVEERLAKLKQLLADHKLGSEQERITLLESPVIDNADELDAYFFDKVGQGLEGVIIKKLGTTYDPGTRNFDWIKLKANTQSDLVDTVDVVVLGYFYGRGERAKYGFGSLLTGAYNPADDSFYSVAKVGSGFTDDQAPRIRADLEGRAVASKPANVIVSPALTPDVWLRPEIVIEIDADEITRSPSHTAATDMKANFETDTKGKGLSLRFPRMKIWARDKKPTQATTASELLRLFELRRSGGGR